jgi:hypothetical protein
LENIGEAACISSIFFAFFTAGKQPYFEISDDHPLNTVDDARDR